ncbi:hypothetical protein [Wolbachia endosymbiont (group A) of Philonthus cognatus]|uniref:hypothetical protein n=1 Tax=Wolbachia endosymbiont (group A) of Philonthus cognatus TaxID=2954046 RepID=UPI00222FF50F|nr:hypothetical protein [Wolbachia endosymbiont (group A) of Philonthus cognatus]
MAKRQPSSRYLLAAEIPRRYDVGLLSSQCLTLGWLCCIATYERLTIVRIISNLLKILFFCNQSDQI